MAETVAGSITVRRGGESWTLALTGQRGDGMSIAQQAVNWMDTIAGAWPIADRNLLIRRLSEQLRGRDTRGKSTKDIVVELPTTTKEE